MKRFTIILVLFSFVSMAQVVPGYQGKKSILAYRLNISPELTQPTYFNKVSWTAKENYPKAESSSFIIPFNLSNSLYYERVLKRKFSIAAGYTFVASKTYINFGQQIIDPLTAEYDDYYFNNAQMNVYGHTAYLDLVFYGRKALAPFGKYFKLHVGYALGYSSFTQDILTSTNQYSNGTYARLDSKDIYYGTSFIGGGFSFGMNRIFKDRIVINRGITFNGIYNIGDSIDKMNVYSSLSKRLARRDILSFYLGIGYLFK